MMCAKIPFFFGVYSLKYTGLFKLARINGVDEGISFLVYLKESLLFGFHFLCQEYMDLIGGDKIYFLEFKDINFASYSLI